MVKALAVIAVINEQFLVFPPYSQLYLRSMGMPEGIVYHFLEYPVQMGGHLAAQLMVTGSKRSFELDGSFRKVMNELLYGRHQPFAHQYLRHQVERDLAHAPQDVVNILIGFLQL